MRILFYAQDGSAATAEVIARRANKEVWTLYNCYACKQSERAEAIEFMADVPQSERDRLVALFSDAVIDALGEDETTQTPDAPAADSPFFAVEIPEGWEDMHWKQRVRLAKDLGGGEFIGPDEANKIISEALNKTAA